MDADRHGVYGGAEGAVRDGRAVVHVHLVPDLDHAREQDDRADVCAGELQGTSANGRGDGTAVAVGDVS